MAPLKLLSLASASLVLIANTEGSDPTYKAEFGNLVCLNEANAARQAAGLTDFAISDEHKHTHESLGGDEKTFCETLIANPSQVTAEMIAKLEADGTLAYMALEGKELNCPAAIKKWQAAFSNFDGLPPNKTDGAELYKNQDNVSFLALYNPSSTATAECRVITCTKNQAERLETEEKSASALMCLTTPPAIGDKVLFEEEQWKKIAKVFTGSASSAVPTLLVAVMAVAGVALF